jgi:hypothetical protein
MVLCNVRTCNNLDLGLRHVLELYRDVAPLHALLSRIYPIAIVQNGQFLVYETDSSLEQFIQTNQAPIPMPVPEHVRAAFPLDCLDGRPACAITADAFDSLDGYAAVFHEFVHCYQSETCEARLKERLRIARDAACRGDCMWELNYSFGYTEPAFSHAYRSFLDALLIGDHEIVWQCRRDLTTVLADDRYEYMVWQEFKEGCARYIENLFRRKVELAPNHHGSQEPFDRVVFYEGGAGFVTFLETEEPGISVQMERLFDRMFEPTQHEWIHGFERYRPEPPSSWSWRGQLCEDDCGGVPSTCNAVTRVGRMSSSSRFTSPYAMVGGK